MKSWGSGTLSLCPFGIHEGIWANPDSILHPKGSHCLGSLFFITNHFEDIFMQKTYYMYVDTGCAFDAESEKEAKNQAVEYYIEQLQKGNIEILIDEEF